MPETSVSTDVWAALETWRRQTVASEEWFVAPRHHVAKPEGALDVGIVSPFRYSLSMGALGHLAIYHRINRDAACPAIADRVLVYEPLVDEHLGTLDARIALDAPLATLERGIPMHALDVLCVSVTNPASAITVLELLRLGDVELDAAARRANGGPVVLAGGPGMANPEPFAAFFDATCVGEGADLAVELLQMLYRARAEGRRWDGDLLAGLPGRIQGLYVPGAYEVEYDCVAIRSITPRSGAPMRVTRRFDQPHDASAASLVTDGKLAVIVPTSGCRRRCAYCQISELRYAESDIAPLLDRIDEYLDRGIETLIVNSATLTQHSDASRLLSGIHERIEESDHRVRVYVGSVRFDELSPEFLTALSAIGAFSHTYLLYTQGSPEPYIALAPEHGSPDLLRRVMRPLDPWRILRVVDWAIAEKVNNFVLYFVVGLEGETREDRRRIAELTTEILDRIEPRGGRVIMKVNPIIPTPGTACQRMAMPTLEEYHGYLTEIMDDLRSLVGADRLARQVELVPLDDDRLAFEGAVTRADRRAAPLITSVLDARRSGRPISVKALERDLASLGFTWPDMLQARRSDDLLPWATVDVTTAKAESFVLSHRLDGELVM